MFEESPTVGVWQGGRAMPYIDAQKARDSLSPAPLAVSISIRD